MRVVHFFMVVIAFLMLMLTGCGGGGSDGTSSSSTTVSGVAAAGAPLAGFVSLVDSSGNPNPPLTTLLNSEGEFSFDITDLNLVPPFFLRAEGLAGSTPYELHSIVTAPGKANVNPITEAQVAAATGMDPAALFDDPTSTSLTNGDMETALEQAATDLKTMLQPLLDAWQIPMFNPITDVYVADGTGLDQLFDVTRVNVDSGEITVIDNATGNPIGSAMANDGGLTVTDEITNDEASHVVISDLEQMQAFLATWLTQLKTVSAGFATGSHSQQEAIDLMMAYYVDELSFGVNNGKNLDQELIENLEDYVFFSAIQNVSSVSIAEFIDNGGVGDIYKLNVVLTLQLFGPSAQYALPQVAVVRGIDSGWKITGNGFYANAGDMDLINFKTLRVVFPEQTNQVTVIDFEIDDYQQAFSSATVTGPGLPAQGLTFYPENFPAWEELEMDRSQMACVRFNADGSCVDNREARERNGFELTDAVIADMPQVCTYIFTFHFADGTTPDEVHTVSMTKPLESTQITDGHFPVINNSFTFTADWALSNLVGNTVTINYSTPTAYDPLHVGLGTDIDYEEDYIDAWVDDVLYGTHQTRSFTFPESPGAVYMKSEIDFSAQDTLWRNYETEYHFTNVEVNLDGGGEDEPDNYAIDYSKIVYYVFEDGRTKLKAEFIISDNGGVIGDGDIDNVSFTDSSGIEVEPYDSDFWTAQNITADCSSGTCNDLGTSEDSGVKGWFANLAEDTYSVEIEMENGQVLTNDVYFPGMVELPWVESSTMDAVLNGDDLVLSWDNPDTEDNWGQVDQLRIMLYDETGNSLALRVASQTDGVPPTIESITIPADMLTDVEELMGGPLVSWEIQTRAYDDNGMNYARAYSEEVQ